MNKNLLSNKVDNLNKNSTKNRHDKCRIFDCLTKMSFKKFLLTTFFIVCIVCLVVSPQKYIDTTLKGILVWATNILPALFPFMIFTRLLTDTGYVEDFSKCFSTITRKLYHTPGISSYVFLMSIISGYPLGAKITADLYENGTISREEAHRICSFTSNSGPMFIVGTVGVGMLISTTAGYIILIAHVLAAILNGLIYRKYKPQENSTIANASQPINKNKTTQKNSLTETMQNGIDSVLIIGSYICIFFVIVEILASLGLFSPLVSLFAKFGIDPNLSNGIIFGFFEITKGCLSIASANVSLLLKTIFCSLVISFGGLAVSFQAFTFLNKFKISKKFFFLQKTTHAVIACALCVILTLLFL